MSRFVARRSLAFAALALPLAAYGAYRLGGRAEGPPQGCMANATEACERDAGHAAKGAAPGVLAEATPRHEPHVLEFSSRSCTACARMAPVVAAVERACSGGDGAIVPVDVDDAPGEQLASRYAVTLLPTFMSVDADGNEVERLEGIQTGPRLAEAVAAARGSACAPL